MLSFKLQAWNALAPGLENSSDWNHWLEQPSPLSSELHKVPLRQIPPMLRRRFTELGRCAAGAALPLLEGIEGVPGIFASRHGDTPLTLSLLEGIAEGEPMSPTGFSLAVHNAVSGLLSIARKDVSEVTAIAAVDNLIPHALLEAVTQLQNSERVLCLIYDVPLPELYQPYTSCEPFPFALAMLLSRSEGVNMSLEQHSPQAIQVDSSDLLRTIRFITGLDRDVHFPVSAEMDWKLSRDE